MADSDKSQEYVRPPSVDRLARSLSGLPQPLLVDAAQEAIAAGRPEDAADRVEALRRSLLAPVINGTGVLLHTNLGRAPFGLVHEARAHTVEFDLETGLRGSRYVGVGVLLAKLCGAESAVVVNNNAAAVLLVLAALAGGRSAAVSRGESVEIGGSFRIPEVMAQSGARLVDVGTTNRTRAADYRAAIAANRDMALLLKVHTSNYHIAGFTETASVAELAALGLPVVADIGSGLLDARTPWLNGPPPRWLDGEPAARQSLEDGAALVTFSGDKLLGGPQAGIIAGRGDLVELCVQHPLARALRPGGLVLAGLQEVALAYLRRDYRSIPFWRLSTTPISVLRRRAEAISSGSGGRLTVVRTQAVPGAGSAPRAVIPSFGVSISGDHSAALRACVPPIIARVQGRSTIIDLIAVHPEEDGAVLAGVNFVGGL